MFSQASLRISYRTNDIHQVLNALSEQTKHNVETRAVQGQIPPQSTAGEALAWAKARATQGGGHALMSRRISEVVINASREFELIWWPELYSDRGFGKLSLRFFVQKTAL